MAELPRCLSQLHHLEESFHFLNQEKQTTDIQIDISEQESISDQLEIFRLRAISIR